jgi:hypothetical protein
MPQRPTKPIQLPHDEGVAGAELVQDLLEDWAVGAGRRWGLGEHSVAAGGATRSSAGSPARPPTSGSGAVMPAPGGASSGSTRSPSSASPTAGSLRPGPWRASCPAFCSSPRPRHGSGEPGVPPPPVRTVPIQVVVPGLRRGPVPTSLRRSTTLSAASTARPERQGRSMARAGSPALRPPAQ